MESNPSAELAKFIHSVEVGDIPDNLIRMAELSYLDTVGVTIAGAMEQAPRSVLALVPESTDGIQSKIIGTDQKAPPEYAGLMNGTAAHVLDYDDVSWAIDAHPSAPLVSGIIALSGIREVSGLDAIRAFIVGFESMCHLSAPISPKHYEIGWHPTGTIGTFGVVAAGSIILKLSFQEIRQGLNIAASMPAGIKRNFGSMTKSLHVGRAVSSGIQAVRLASEGFTADSKAIGGEKGFLEIYGGNRPSKLESLPQKTNDWFMDDEGIHRKLYPTCYFTQSSIYAVGQLVTQHNIQPKEIESISAYVSKGAHDALPHNVPSTPLEAKFSMQYTLSYMAQYGELGLEAFNEESVSDVTVRDLIPRVHLEVNKDLNYNDHGTTVLLSTSDRDYEMKVKNPPGSHDNPFTSEEIKEKFELCADGLLEKSRQEVLIKQFDSLRSQPSLAEALEKI